MKHEGAFSYKGKLQPFGGGNAALMTSTATKKGPLHPTHFAGLLYNVARYWKHKNIPVISN